MSHIILKRSLHVSSRSTRSLLTRHTVLRNQLWIAQSRSIVSLVGALRSVLKIRYLVFGSAIGGGYQFNKKYNEWKDSLPELNWIKDLIPNSDQQQMLKDNLVNMKERLLADDGLLRAATKNAQETLFQFRELLRERRQDSQNGELPGTVEETPITVVKIKNPFASTSSPKEPEQDYERIKKLQEELIEIQHKYQKEIERLEKENKQLRKSLLLKSDSKGVSERLKKVNKTLIDLYSDVLDEMNDFDSNYNTQDHLPRVIVVGDQSAGKTSVLEMIAQARIFPRGAGEMMTRSPVKVTLKEGPYHVARFKDSNREFDLTKEEDLASLRSVIETKMKSKVRDGKSVSKDVIAMTVEGPGLPRMVLIDLPGVISTVTTEMAADTREAIEDISKCYMNNPNAIILCVQDGSVDAERSIVTDMVSQVDPSGKRTIFVMTKMDLAEQNMANPSRLKKILNGQLFPMKALGYFAVVTGRGGKNDTIQDIRNYEEDFFKNSKLCKQGVFSASQCTTQSLSLAVSDRFWKMVKSSVEQQADLYKARKFNLETEWRNTFSKYRELDKDELFEIGKNQILDQIIKLSHFTSDHWESLLFKNLHESFMDSIFDDIYMPAAAMADNFNVQVDIRLQNWIQKILPEQTVAIGWKVLSGQFKEILDKKDDIYQEDPNPENDYYLFQNLKNALAEDALSQHKWDSKAYDVLKLIQTNASEDRMISENKLWKESVKFLQETLIQRIKSTNAKLHELIGPDWIEQWGTWKYRSREQFISVNIKNELDKLASQNNLTPTLSTEEIFIVKKSLKTRKIEVADEDITSLWSLVYTNQFLRNLLSKAKDCEKQYAHYLYKMESEVSCDDVVLFYRIRQILEASSKALRQQITNIETQRLNREVKEILDDYNQDSEKKSTLLTGKRVTLAEELKRVRQIQDKLEEFIAALNKEK